ncbi:predicted protein [Chaetoceros tenuissimus]|uniref:Uncharacterized protein n=1 Tax=Chaetoceros tenuissimus TaxID=426638 RepID=A0AAD3CHJ8_9STRA|nr:predicted protein [Chaetoceros tenuissimus]
MAITKNDSTSKEGLDDEYDTCDYVNIASAIPVPNPNTSEVSGTTGDNYSFTPSETGVDYNQYPQHDSTKEDSTKYQNSNQIGAGVVAAVIAMPLLGPVFATAAGVAAAYGTTQDGPAGDACRAAGDVALIAIDRPHTPKELWTTLRGAIVNDGVEQACEPLTNYLQACMSRPAPHDLSHLALDSDDLPTVVALDPDLIAHRRRLLYEDFPHFNNSVGHTQATLVSQGIHALTQEVHLGRIQTQQERDRARNKTYQSEYPASYQRLLSYAQVQNGNLLQPVWNQLARAKKGDRIRILHQHLELAKQQLQLTYVKVDTTPGILEKFFNLQYHSASATGNFKEYFNSFLLDTSNSSVVQQATLYETLHSGGAAPSAADLQLISDLDIKASTDTVSYLYLIQKYLIYHQCLWGGAHPVTTSLATYYRMLNQKQVELQMYQSGCKMNDRLLFWPRLQFNLQTEIDYWFDMASYPNVQPADLPTLNTHGVFQAIRLHNQWEPIMGSHYLEQLGLKTVYPSPAPAVGGLQGRDDSDSRDQPAENRTITNPTFNADLFNQYREDRTMPARELKHFNLMLRAWDNASQQAKEKALKDGTLSTKEGKRWE